MAGGTVTVATTNVVKTALLLLTLPVHGAAQETCTGVTVTGDFPGVYEQEGSVYVGVDESSGLVMQTVEFAADSRMRRNLQSQGGRGRRRLQNDCTSQMWIIANTSALEEDGFPYYSSFDCAEHPASVESTWLLVECDDCAEVTSLSVTCTPLVDPNDVNTSDGGDDGTFTLPVIIGIAVGGLVLLLCLGFCVSRHHRNRKGSRTFADDSEHNIGAGAEKKVGGDAGGGGGMAVMRGGSSFGMSGGSSGTSAKGPVPSYSTGVDDTVESPLATGRVSGKGVSSDRRLISNGKSFKPNHAGGSTPAYEGIFASRPAGGGRPASIKGAAPGPTTIPHRPAVEMSKYSGTRADSMAAAAVAASASSRPHVGSGGSSAGGTNAAGSDSPEAFSSVLSSGVVEEPAAPPSRRAPRGGVAGINNSGIGGDIKWSAGQNIGLEYDHGGISDYGDDSAAGSVYELNPTDAVEHRYNTCDDSVAASSPGAYSMYSHYTAGGGGLPYPRADRESADWSSSNDSPDRDGGTVGAVGRVEKRVPSPAGLMARADRHTNKDTSPGEGYR